ncbi:MAG TPA: hypothetical protein VGJ70_06515 [Solirubrobacteraceae bacterium]
MGVGVGLGAAVGVAVELVVVVVELTIWICTWPQPTRKSLSVTQIVSVWLPVGTDEPTVMFTVSVLFSSCVRFTC